jgi:hypothetical protein
MKKTSTSKRTATDLARVGAAKPIHPHAWLWESVEHEPSFVLRSMFGAKAVYLHGLMMLCFCASDEPWRGILICTDRERHAALMNEFPSLTPHPVLAKWLYLPESAADFETTGTKLLRLARQRDPRVGIVPQSKKRAKPSRSKIKTNLSS